MAIECYHCGQACAKDAVVFNDKNFCCNGCKTVYEILNQSELKTFYDLNKTPGIQPDEKGLDKFGFLDTKEVFDKIVDFDDDGIVVVQFHIPVIHCSSCVWVLESLRDIDSRIIQSPVNFAKRTIQISYRSEEMKLSEVAKLLAMLGYKPSIHLESGSKESKKVNRRLIFQLVIAGFCFGNIMLLAFPEYINPNEQFLYDNRKFFRWFMFALSLPVVTYSAQDYLKAAWAAIRTKKVNIDLPIAIGILVLFFRSTYEIVADLSPGYFDSLAGLVFFMLIGKWFQRQTYESLSFERDYKSFYPISITRINKDSSETILLEDLKKGDRILLKDEEILPADAILIKGDAQIDNSFVTGESRLIKKVTGDKIFAGGKQKGSAIELEIIAELNQSYLTQLWNNEAFGAGQTRFDALIDRVSRYFVFVILGIALLSAIAWYFIDTARMFQVVTAILIIACPCALALSVPFTLGNVMRIFGRNNLYVKDTQTIENLADIDTIVFDKTGTITENKTDAVTYIGDALSAAEEEKLKALFSQSNHPLSRILSNYFEAEANKDILDYKQITGSGQSAIINGTKIKAGSAKWLNVKEEQDNLQTRVYIEIDNKIKGYFSFQNQYRQGLKKLIGQLSGNKLFVLSGDNEAEKGRLKEFFPPDAEFYFNQSPQQKLTFIQDLQEVNKKKVMMIGDGLNDAGALKQSNVGIALAEDMNSFSPSCDAILSSKAFYALPKFIQLSKRGMTLVKIAFTISFLYNIIGLSFAITGNLQPVVAAILMPISSVSIVLFSTLSSWLSAYLIMKK